MMNSSEQFQARHTPIQSKGEWPDLRKQDSYPVLFFSSTKNSSSPGQLLQIISPQLGGRMGSGALTSTGSSDPYLLPPSLEAFNGDQPLPESKQGSVSNFRFEESVGLVGLEEQVENRDSTEELKLGASLNSLGSLHMLSEHSHGDVLGLIHSRVCTPLHGFPADTQMNGGAGNSDGISSRSSQYLNLCPPSGGQTGTPLPTQGGMEAAIAAAVTSANTPSMTAMASSPSTSFSFPMIDPSGNAFSFVSPTKLYEFVDNPGSTRNGGGSIVTMSTELPPTVIHRGLQSKCRFIPFPPQLPSHHCSAAGQNDHLALFIGQVRFETMASELIWLIHRTCGACASHLESRGAGCYLVFLKSQADLDLVRGLHKRILFDIGGVWIARTPEEVDALCEYVAVTAPVLSKRAHLPRDSMVVEELKVDPNKFYGSPYHNQHMFHQNNNNNNSNNNNNNNNNGMSNNHGSGNNGHFNGHLLGGNHPLKPPTLIPASSPMQVYHKNQRMCLNNGNKNNMGMLSHPVSTPGGGGRGSGGGGNGGGMGIVMVQGSPPPTFTLPSGAVMSQGHGSMYPQGMMNGNGGGGGGGSSTIGSNMGISGTGAGGGSGGMIMPGRGNGNMNAVLRSLSDAPPSYFMDGGSESSTSKGMEFVPLGHGGRGGSSGSAFLSSMASQVLPQNHGSSGNGGGGGSFTGGFNAGYTAHQGFQYVPVSTPFH